MKTGETCKLNIRRLKLKEIKDIYRKHLVHDFPLDERRPFPRIAKHYREHRYEGFGGYSEAGELLCYAMFYVKTGPGGRRVCLFDYLAVVAGFRDGGVGSAFLKGLGKMFPRTGCAFVEVEDPERAADPNQRSERERRMQFYLRNGFLDTGLNARVFGVDYRILEVPLPANADWHIHSTEEMRRDCEMVYQSMFPRIVYDRFCELYKAAGDKSPDIQ